MRNNILLLIAAILVLFSGCGTKEEQKPEKTIGLSTNIEGDSTLYGLACDGCTDSILVFLPYSGGDPDTFDIIECRQQRHMLGRPHIGDALAVIVNPENRSEALWVINMGRLVGEWCYVVEPTLRTIDGKTPPLPDSIKKKILNPVEYCLKLKTDNTASMMGHVKMNGNAPSLAVYPDVHRYSEWRLFNGRLILHADTIAGFTKEGEEPVTDTADIVLLMRDSLILRIGDKEQSYYRKKVSDSQ